MIEVGIPSLRRLRPGETVIVSHYREGYHCVDEFDVANQGLVSHHFTAEDGGFRERSIPFRYVWPSELDLMARIAGLRLRERWSGWAREPFTSESTGTSPSGRSPSRASRRGRAGPRHAPPDLREGVNAFRR